MSHQPLPVHKCNEIITIRCFCAGTVSLSVQTSFWDDTGQLRKSSQIKYKVSLWDCSGRIQPFYCKTPKFTALLWQPCVVVLPGSNMTGEQQLKRTCYCSSLQLLKDYRWQYSLRLAHVDVDLLPIWEEVYFIHHFFKRH